MQKSLLIVKCQLSRSCVGLCSFRSYIPEIEELTNTEFGKLLEHVNFGRLDVGVWLTDAQDVSEEFLGVVAAPVDDTLSKSEMAQP